VPKTNDFPRGFEIGENYEVRGSDASVRTGVLASLDMSGQERTAIWSYFEYFRITQKLLLISGPQDLRWLRFGHFGSHAVAELPNIVHSQVIVSRSKLTNRRSTLLLDSLSSLELTRESKNLH